MNMRIPSGIWHCLLALTACAAPLAAQPPADAGLDSGLVGRWQLSADRVSGQSFAPLAGKLSAVASQPVQFDSNPPKAMRLEAVKKDKGRLTQFVTICDDASAAGLPAGAITVEAWVLMQGGEKASRIVGALGPGPAGGGWELGNAGRCLPSPWRPGARARSRA